MSIPHCSTGPIVRLIFLLFFNKSSFADLRHTSFTNQHFFTHVHLSLTARERPKQFLNGTRRFNGSSLSTSTFTELQKFVSSNKRTRYTIFVTFFSHYCCLSATRTIFLSYSSFLNIKTQVSFENRVNSFSRYQRQVRCVAAELLVTPEFRFCLCFC